ncbi:MAG: TIGR03943 family putative permease subunit, partial [Waterburya sp.]
GIPVKLETSRHTYPPDTWLEIQGTMLAETLLVPGGVDSKTAMQKRSVVLAAKSIKSIPIPADPYGYK